MAAALLLIQALPFRSLAQDGQPPLVVRDVAVQGHRGIQEAVILGRVQTRAGSPFTSARVAEDIRAIFALGFFQDVQVKVEELEGGVKLTFVVVVHPFIRDIEFTGNRQIDTRTLREKLDLKLGVVYNPVDAQRAADGLRDYYEEEGYFEVRIRPEAETFPDGDLKVVLQPPTPSAAPAPPPPRVPGAAPAIPREPAEAPGPDRPPFIVAYRGINVLVIQARKAELEVIRRLVSQLDVDLYAGRQVFIYFPEHVRAKDLAATLNAIFGRPKDLPTVPPPPAAPGPPPLLAPPPPPPRRGPPSPPGAPMLGPPTGTLQFIPDETTNALIVTRNGLKGEQARAERQESSTGGASGPLGEFSGRLHRGFVIIDANPPHAQVFLDGQLLGTARQLVARAFPVPVGNHTLEIAAPGFRPYLVRFSVSPSLPARIRVALNLE
ncbi:MAG: PEGA domain-containing protein [Candidatus Rokubacteria bacterium]|nr:PEGA domain-containing protein [Candidatus Rokubacteria bacterium]